MKKILIFLFSFYLSLLSANSLSDNIISKNTFGFEENKGQVIGQDSALVTYFYKYNNATFFLLKNGLSYQFEKRYETDSNPMIETYRMDLIFEGSNENVTITTEGKSVDYINYYNRNVLDVHSYEKVIYHNLYKNIDWVIYKYGDKLKHEFVVHPNGNPDDIKLKLKWVESPEILKNGSLRLQNSMGEIIENCPISFQKNDTISTNFILQDNILSFHLSNYDKTSDLTIDPEIEWSTYYGGNWDDFGIKNCVDINGNAYLAGTTNSSTYIASGGHQNTIIFPHDAFLVKFNSAGTRLWATYYGGDNFDWASSCTTDGVGNIYLCGSTESVSNISYLGHQNTYPGYWSGADNCAFLVKFNSIGNRMWATYYGGIETTGLDCKTDINSNVYLCGITRSDSLISYNGFQNNKGSSILSSFLVKFNSSGTRQWGTYYNGDAATSCAVDGSNNIYITGYTNSDSSVAFNGFQNSRAGLFDIFIAKFNPTGTRLWSSYYGGPNNELTPSCAVDNQDNLIVSGYTNSNSNIASLGFDTIFNPNHNAFVVKFNSTGSRLWSSYIGGGGELYTNTSSNHWDVTDLVSCTTDQLNNIYIAGHTYSSTGIAYEGIQNTFKGVTDAFVIMLNPNGEREWGTYFGDLAAETSISISANNTSNIYLSGTTLSNNLAKLGHQSVNNGLNDAFLTKISPSCAVNIYDYQNSTVCKGNKIRFFTSPIQGGSSPKYKWYRNSTLIDSLPIIFTNNFEHGDTIYCILTSSLPFLSIDTAVSNKIIVNVIDKDTTILYDTVCKNIGYLFNDSVLTTSGWYYDTLFNEYFCDSFIFLHLTVKNSDTLVLFDSICKYTYYSFNNQNLTTTGTYFDTFTNQIGCDSLIILNLFVKPVDTTFLLITNCDSGYYIQHSKTYTQSGIYYDTLINQYQCDSILVLDITFYKRDTTSIYDTICSNESYSFNGQNLTIAGTYRQGLINHKGCDSIIFLYLVVNPLDTTYLTKEICKEESYNFLGTNVTQTGKYYHTLRNQYNCDSLIVLDLYVNKFDTTKITKHICEGDTFTFYSQKITAPGIYYSSFINSKGCDSFIELSLIVNPIYNHKEYKIICEGDFYLGFSISGIYPIRYTTSEGCDSLVELNLSVIKKQYDTINYKACDSIYINDISNSLSTSFNDTIKNSLGCDSLIRTNVVDIFHHNYTSLPDTFIEFCDSIMVNGIYIYDNAIYKDTIQKIIEPYCDSGVRTIYYNYHPSPIISLYVSPSTQVKKGQVVTITANEQQNYLWNTGDKTRQIKKQIMEDELFSLKVWNHLGCNNTESVKISIEPIDTIGLPNAFSPNGDGLNDVFEFNNFTDDFQLIKTSIFNRIGEKVYESDSKLSWDGTYKNTLVPQGIFVYTIYYKIVATQEIIKKIGTVFVTY